MATDKENAIAILAREVGAAILSDQIGYAVQPFFNTTTQSISGAECLLRWRLEDGSIVPLDHYLSTFVTLEWQAPYMKHLLEKKQKLFSAIRSAIPINVHFNYTAEALKSAAFKSRVIQELRRKQTDLRGWVIEISEQDSGPQRSIIDDEDLVVLRNSGVKLAIDDFGVGHSNLERVMNVDADIVKLDRRFVADGRRSERCMSILRHVRHLTNSLGMKLIAEGIETAEQESMLTDLGIVEHQGFFRGRPMSPEAFLAKLQQQRFDETMAV
jgi:EAL domain-containing protein (putative c-di-GMP-specific phosphodiesterase class I)